jgi:histone-lysine N-methyltransferase SETD8
VINQDHDHDYNVKLPAPEVEPKKPAKQPASEGNKKITEFFTVRRSVRKTKKEVQAERMRTLEQAIMEEKEEGLEVRSKIYFI